MSRALLAAWAVVLSSVAACGSPRELCERECECTGCAAQELQDCYDTAESDKQEAQEHDCLGEYDDLVSCKLDEFACIEGALQTEFCLEEIEAYPACLTGN